MSQKTGPLARRSGRGGAGRRGESSRCFGERHLRMEERTVETHPQERIESSTREMSGR